MKKMACITYLVCMVLMLSTPATKAKELTGSLSQQTYSITDNDKVYVTVAGTNDDGRYQELTKLFTSDAEFAAIKDAAHYHTLSTDQTMYKARYSHDFPGFPDVRVQSVDGTILKEWSGTGVPDNAALLAEMKCLPRWRKPCKPDPKQPAPEPAKQPVTPEPEAHPHLTFWVALIAVCVGVGAAFINEMRRA